jgi:hypothetical protein
MKLSTTCAGIFLEKKEKAAYESGFFFGRSLDGMIIIRYVRVLTIHVSGITMRLHL